MAGSLAVKTAGFTLLEALIALSIAAFLLTGLYRVVNGTARQVDALEKRTEAMHLWIHLRRLLKQDLEHLTPEPPAHIVLDGKEALILHCTGDILPDWSLGPSVDVIYQWKTNPSGNGMTWERLIKPTNGDRADATVTLRIDQGLNKVDYALLEAKEWRLFGEGAPIPWKAIRWRFDWDEIGEWTLIQNLLPPASYKNAAHP